MMFTVSPAPSQRLAPAPAWAYLSLLLSAVLALTAVELLAVIVLSAQSGAPARPASPSVEPPNLVWPHRPILVRAELSDVTPARPGGPGGDPRPSPGIAVSESVAGDVPLLGIVLISAVMTTVALGAIAVRSQRLHPTPRGT